MLVGYFDSCVLFFTSIMSELAQYWLSQRYLGLKQEYLVFLHKLSYDFSAPLASAEALN